MRIEGAGGCFDDRVYEVDRALCWKIVKLSINEMGPMGDVIDDVDEEVSVDEESDVVEEDVEHHQEYQHRLSPAVEHQAEQQQNRVLQALWHQKIHDQHRRQEII